MVISQFKSFWIVWTPTEIIVDNEKHNSYESAIAEARRLAKKHSECDFYVLETKHKVYSNAIVVEQECYFEGVENHGMGRR